MTAEPLPLSNPPPHFIGDYHDWLLQQAYDSGYFEPRGKRKHKSGLVIDFLVPPVLDSYLDGPGF